MYTKEKLLENIKLSWYNIIKNELDKEYFIQLLEKLNNDYKTNIIYPKIDNIFQVFKYFDIHETNIVLLGQDPYHSYKIINNNKIPQANGLSFSVSDNIPIPPSLRNIYKELKIEYPEFNIPKTGNLERWVKEEKILLLNSSLTVNEKMPGSHIKYWELFTDYIIKYISDNVDNVVFILLGNYSKKKIKLINKERIINKEIKILTAIHPSPLSANRGFFNSNIFKEANKFLNNKINWNI